MPSWELIEIRRARVTFKSFITSNEILIDLIRVIRGQHKVHYALGRDCGQGLGA